MSTILDSLKKSSDQRNDSDKSSIDNFSFGNENKQTKSKNRLMYLIVFVFLIAVIYWAYDNFYDPQTVNEEEAIIANAENTKNIETISKNINQIPKTETTNKKRPKPNNSIVKTDIKKAKKQKIESKRKQTLADLNKPKSTGSVKQLSNNETKPKNLTKNIDKKETQNNQPEKIQKQKREAPKNNTIARQKYKYIYQLPFSIRKDIPTLKLNIHVFDENPDNRIAVINGVKFLIGDLIEELVLIKNITQDGVVLEFNGTVFLIPKL
jgi:general secretion pathway protein B